MNIIRMAECRVDRLVDALFAESPDQYGQFCKNRITGVYDVNPLDPIEPQKRAARRALLARERFALNGPPDAPELPLSYWERERLKIGGLPTIVALYARSLDGRDYDLEEHPSFQNYACGVMASEHNGYDIKEDEQLRKRFPPRPLTGLGPGLVWEPPALHAKSMASWRRSKAREAAWSARRVAGNKVARTDLVQQK